MASVAVDKAVERVESSRQRGEVGSEGVVGNYNEALTADVAAARQLAMLPLGGAHSLKCLSSGLTALAVPPPSLPIPCNAFKAYT